MVFKCVTSLQWSLEVQLLPTYAYTEQVAATQEGRGRVLPGPVALEPLFKSSS